MSESGLACATHGSLNQNTQVAKTFDSYQVVVVEARQGYYCV